MGTAPVAMEARRVARTSMRSVWWRRLRMTVVASLCWMGTMTRWISRSCSRARMRDVEVCGERLAERLGDRVHPAVGDEQFPDDPADLTLQVLGPGGDLRPLEFQVEVLTLGAGPLAPPAASVSCDADSSCSRRPASVAR